MGARLSGGAAVAVISGSCEVTQIIFEHLHLCELPSAQFAVFHFFSVHVPVLNVSNNRVFNKIVLTLFLSKHNISNFFCNSD